MLCVFGFVCCVFFGNLISAGVKRNPEMGASFCGDPPPKRERRVKIHSPMGLCRNWGPPQKNNVDFPSGIHSKPIKKSAN